jgi:hypothetical protein
VHRARSELVVLLGLLDLQSGPPTQDVGHQAPVARIEVLDHHHRRRKVSGKAREELAEGIQTARRSRDGDHLEARLGRS